MLNQLLAGRKVCYILPNICKESRVRLGWADEDPTQAAQFIST